MLEKDDELFFVPNQYLPVNQRDIVDKMIQEMKEVGVVTPSGSHIIHLYFWFLRKMGLFLLDYLLEEVKCSSCFRSDTCACY